MSQLKDFHFRTPKKLIFISLILAMMADFIPIAANLYWLPNITLLVLIYWLANCPHFINIGWSFVLGLLVDMGTNSPLGGHALAFTLVAYVVINHHRQFGMQNYGFQSLLVLLTVGMAELVLLVVGWFSTSRLPEWSVFFAPLLGAVLWLVINHVLSTLLQKHAFR